ncbi:MAG: sigma-70 family RNA polymerase sigma factor [Thermoguttaceae bacterium]|nr:sigma-70 family RNA polymerase sigma factor [Thermoguttaceae bacterium]MDW8037642.1 sigma-70 family RNA polymerase sigma factor [Thermoguttaceae bacterium]
MDDASDLWTDWFREHGPALLLYARQWAMDQTDAEDILQEAFVRYWPHRAQVADPLAYVYSCVRNVAQDWRRRVGSRPEQFGRSELAQTENGFSPTVGHNEPPWFEPGDASLIQQELAQQVQDALSVLPQEQREVVVLKIWAGLSFSAIGQVMGTSPHTAASRYRYALKALQTQLRKALH